MNYEYINPLRFRSCRPADHALQVALACVVMLAGSTSMAAGDGYRYENLTDEEVREIQRSVAGVSAWPITVISGAGDKCRCEEGPACTSQVVVTVQQSGDSDSIEVSKIDGQWVIGRWQHWLLRERAWHQYLKQHLGDEKHLDFAAQGRAYRALDSEKPVCAVPAPASAGASGETSGK